MYFKIKKRLLLTFVLLPLVASIVLCVNIYRQRLNDKGYIAYNIREYTQAREAVSLIAELGDARAQNRMAYMHGLGLGGPVDIPEAMRLFAKLVPYGANMRDFLGKEAYYIGVQAISGVYGDDKIQLGRLWLNIADASGSKEARLALNPEPIDFFLELPVPNIPNE